MKPILIIGASALLFSSGGAAQRVPSGELNPHKPLKTDKALKEGVRAQARDTRRVVQEFARCIARRDSARVDKYLASPDLRFSQILGDRGEDCLGEAAGDESRLSGKSDTFRYPLAEAYLVRKYREKGLPDVALIAPLEHPQEVGVPHGLGTLSECIIRHAPTESWSLLRTDAASPEEKAAFAALGPAMEACVRQGTTVKMYLPRLLGNIDEQAEEPAFGSIEAHGQETILVCEDDEDVRAYSAEVLRELGYKVLEAADGPAALAVLEANGHVDLLFTDVVLPGGMSGAVLAKEAAKLQAGIKTLFTTGYARNAIVHHGRLDAGVDLITKPFSYADLAARVRDVLDRTD